MENNIEENSINENKQIEENAKIRGLVIGFLAGVLLMSAIFGTVKLISYLTSNSVKSLSVQGVDMKKIEEISDKIDKNFYLYSEDTTTDYVAEGIYRGMLESLNDKYSEYYSVKELEEAINETEGISYGIGCYVSISDEYNMPIVAGVMEDSPAQKAGVIEGDVIYEVDNESTAGLTLSEVVSRIKGLKDTQVHIKMYRESDGEYHDFDITRGEVIETNTVEYGTLVDAEDIGYIRIKEFADATVQQYIDAMDDLRTNEHIKGLVLDLRSNSGGALNAAVDIGRQILPAGLIVYTENKDGKRTEYSCDGDNVLDIPMVVLTNKYTASAAEILAGAIQDYQMGTLLGTTTFGKGIVQRIFDLKDGSAIKLTISAYFTPSGRNIQGTGIEPDIELEYDYDAATENGEDNQVNKAIEILKQKIGE